MKNSKHIVGVDFKINFITKISEDDQQEFWESFIEHLEIENLTFGGGHNESYFTGFVDFSLSKKEPKTLLNHLNNFYIDKASMIKRITINFVR
jgi:uncharacterized protein YggL (DUF469 family)